MNTNDENQHFDENEIVEQTTDSTNGEAVDNATEVTDDTLSSLQQALIEANHKVEENWNLFLSAKADADNIQKRAQRDVSNAHKYALEKFIPELLKVKDSLELGVKAAKENMRESSEQLASFVEGSEMTVTMFNDTLSKFGVVMLDPQGQTFNPEFHQAMTMVPNKEVAPNTVIEVVQKGYTLNERLLRPAMVIVSKNE